ncbi:MAG: carbohydrate kinase family protein [Caldilineales bacterium]|nr:carbohydrate kinase family protein [Caldilineales bacterium]
MAVILVCGLINLETTLRVEGFPVAYTPVQYPFFGVRSTVAGVGYNLAAALTRLGHEVRLLSLVGQDQAGALAQAALAAAGIAAAGVLATLPQTAQSVILYDGAGRRMIYTDLKDIQEQRYPGAGFAQALAGCDLAVLCNINFARPFLAAARARGVPVATDVHAIADLEDAYNADFMAAADILFMSHERLPCPAAEWAARVQARYDPAVIGVGLGGEGALLACRGQGPRVIPAVFTRPVVNTIGAGDALFAAFLHGVLSGEEAPAAMAGAVVFASYKIGAVGAAEGFLSAGELAGWGARASTKRSSPPATRSLQR